MGWHWSHPWLAPLTRTFRERSPRGERFGRVEASFPTRITSCFILIELRPHFVPGLPHVVLNPGPEVAHAARSIVDGCQAGLATFYVKL